MRVHFSKRESLRTPLVVSWTPPYNCLRSCDHPEIQIDSPFPAFRPLFSFSFSSILLKLDEEEDAQIVALADIYPEDALPVETKRWESLLAKFKDLYGKQADFVARSPGRVNIIGEVRYLQESRFP